MEVLERTTIFAAVCIAITLVVPAGCNKKDDAVSVAEQAEQATGVAAPVIAEMRKIAEEGFIYGLPIVMNYAIMNEFAIDKDSGQFKAPFNAIFNDQRVFTYKDTAVVTPNSDTPYSMVWLDLRAEPMVISVPAVEKKRYYSVQLIDGNAYNYGYIGSRATGNDAGDYLVTGPDWTGEQPAEIKQTFRSTTPFSLTIFRTQLFDSEDMPHVVEIQKGYSVKPLSAYLAKPAPPAAPVIDFPPASTKGIKDHFYEYLDAALEFIPKSPQNEAILNKLAGIGIGPGKIFKFVDLSLEHKAAFLLAMKDGEDKVKQYLATGMKELNGWRVGTLFGDRAFYNGDWLKRAAAAQGGIYGNDAVEATYPMTRSDADGDALDGSKHSYTLTFPAGQLPPVNAFWSVTMYDGKTQLLIENPIDRYLINSPLLPSMKRNEDGSLTIYIQKDSPGGEEESNWLPAPNGPIYLVMRLYWPKTEPPSILPVGDGTWSPPAVMKAE